MKPGPLPKPTSLKVIEGNRGHRPLLPDAVQPLVAEPDCPAHLNGDARTEWKRIVPLLVKYRLVTEIDTTSLALYCQVYGRWQEAERRIAVMKEEAAGGDYLMVKAPSGYPIQNPYLSIANRAMEDCYKYLQQFGLSPSARTRVVPAPLNGDLSSDDKKGKSYF